METAIELLLLLIPTACAPTANITGKSAISRNGDRERAAIEKISLCRGINRSVRWRLSIDSRVTMTAVVARVPRGKSLLMPVTVPTLQYLRTPLRLEFTAIVFIFFI